ncbi:hypothetical protein RJ639_006841 [Escallonia herrerae]|uniref:X8 domain-containing protein n=1 Tax=Escallonia herrerae TaxID=1293975 RepID=A0AA88VYU7_9ASTE|nr:hypothetical protein RJ639_006841 [Escallonia herrerae]
MLKMVCFIHLLLLSLLGFTVADQESVGIITLHDDHDSISESLRYTGVPVAVPVSNQHLNEVSGSVSMAEKWVRTHVLNHYPATNITTVVVGHTLFCMKNPQHNLKLVLPSIKNIHHSLIRWGLEREIKVSVSFSSNCLNPSAASYTPDLANSCIKPILQFLEDINSTYTINPPPHLSTIYDETPSLVKTHLKSMENLGVYNLKKINVITISSKHTKPTSRKLTFIDSKLVEPVPAHSPVFYSVPAAKSPLPPLVGTSPELPPMVGPANPPYGQHLPPCNPSSGGGGGGAAAAPVVGRTHSGLWCVAKPSVPADTLQQAMDYACGEGGADCEAIKPYGRCYFPDSLVAHASYAFNSYWQKNKGIGGTCGFGGTAMLINSDPSMPFPSI